MIQVVAGFLESIHTEYREQKKGSNRAFGVVSDGCIFKCIALEGDVLKQSKVITISDFKLFVKG